MAAVPAEALKVRHLSRSWTTGRVLRGTLPTGKTESHLGAGRFEGLVDAGLSANIGETSAWAGVARRFRTKAFDTPGRDINEFYAGLKRSMGEKTELRFDYLRAQSPWRGERNDNSISAAVSRGLRSNATLVLSANRINDIYGKRTEANVTLSYPFKKLA